jgi:DNA-binding response OmpR family regulator
MSDPAGLLVFVVDDELSIASTLTLILKSQGYRAKFFTDPATALEAAASEMPDLLITDAIMPGLSGIELAIQVTMRCPECKVFLLSGQAPAKDQLALAREKGLELEVLHKPVHPSVLLGRIGAVVAAMGGTASKPERSPE